MGKSWPNKFISVLDSFSPDLLILLLQHSWHDIVVVGWFQSLPRISDRFLKSPITMLTTSNRSRSHLQLWCIVPVSCWCLPMPCTCLSSFAVNVADLRFSPASTQYRNKPFTQHFERKAEPQISFIRSKCSRQDTESGEIEGCGLFLLAAGDRWDGSQVVLLNSLR